MTASRVLGRLAAGRTPEELVDDYPFLEGVTPHAFRHTCASLMRAAGADVKEIQAQLGHRSPVVTLSVYTHLFEDAYDSVMDRLDTDHRDLVRPKSGPNVVELSERKPSQASDQGV